MMDLDKFARAPRLRWPWLQWKDPTKAWVGKENPCNKEDIDLFYAATIITIGDGRTANFWQSPWLHGQKPKSVAPTIFAISTTKNFTVNKGITNEFCITNINMAEGITTQHIIEFVNLWTKVREFHLVEGTADDITWKFTTSGLYTAASAYKAQFEGLTRSTMLEMVWKNWAPPKCKLFAWLVLQNRVWTADRLQRRGWPNCGLCQLCKREAESATHLLFKCRYTIRVWNMVIAWLGLSMIDTSQWHSFSSMQDWWNSVIYTNGTQRKSLASLIMLVCWEIWTERNVHVFRHVSTMPTVIFERIKSESVVWCAAGAKQLGSIIPGE